MATKIFFDTEMTGLHPNTTIISIGMVSEHGLTFYAEFNDYDKSQVTKWIRKNVLKKLKFNDTDVWNNQDFIGNIEIKDGKERIKTYLKEWLKQFEEYEFWNDCLAFDWVLLADLLGGLEGVKEDDKYYYNQSLCSLDKILGVPLEILQETQGKKGQVHNSLHDAMQMKERYQKMEQMMEG